MTSPKAALLTGLSNINGPRHETLRHQRALGYGVNASSTSQLPLVLASGSPRRLLLLEQIGIEPAALRPASIDETPKRAEMPRALVNRLARAKAEVARDQIANDTELADAYVLSADTVVCVGRRILGKPAILEEAVASLELLSGRAHRVLTGICLITPDDRIRTRIVETRVQFRRLSRIDIEAYIASREWRGKSGGYAIQGLASCFVQKLVGSYTNVVGLPLTEVAGLLMGEGQHIHRGWLNNINVEAD